MLDFIRSNTQSWGIKIAFGIIIVVFVFWGLGSVQNMSSSSVVATVNGHSILQHEFLMQYQNAEENFRLNSPDITPEQLNSLGIGNQVLQKMIVDALLQEEAKRIGLTVTPRELLKNISAIPSFHNDKGNFDKDKYLNILKAQRVSPGRFEKDVSKGLLEEKLRFQVTEGAYVLPSTVRTLYNYSRERRVVEYIYFTASDYMDMQPSDDDIKKFYENNKNLFILPAQIKVEFITVSPLELGEVSKFTEQEINDYYSKNINDFTIPAQADVSHILINLSENASEEEVGAATLKLETALKEFAQNKNFEELAQKYSEDAITADLGGKIGLVGKGDTVKEFDEAVFSLKENTVSGIVRTSFGLHIVKLNELVEARVEELEEVVDEINNQLKIQAGNDKIHIVIDALVEGNIVGTPLKELAKENALSTESTELLTLLEVQDKLNINENDAELLMQAIEGAPYDTAIETIDGGYLVAKILESKPASTEPMATVKDEIIEELKDEQGLKLALSEIEEVRKTMGNELPAKYTPNIITTSALVRGQSIPIFENNQEMSVAIFSTDEGMWLPSTYEVYGDEGDGAVLIRVKEIMPDSGEGLATIEGMLTESIKTARKNEMFTMLITSLMAKAKILVENPDMVNRKGF